MARLVSWPVQSHSHCSPHPRQISDEMKRWGFDVRFRSLRGPEDFNSDPFVTNAHSIDTCCAALFILTEEGVHDQSGFLDELLYASNQAFPRHRHDDHQH
jgi:hypothetical protein